MSLHPPSGQTQTSDTIPEADVASLNDLITANHILYKHNVLDGFGHISVRSTSNPNMFYQTGIASALITSPSNFTIYHTNNGTTVDPSVKTSPYSEHYIHAAFLDQYPDVQCVIHSHARETLPFGINDDEQITTTNNNTDGNTNRFRAVIHTAGFLGTNVPIWDAETAYTDLGLTQQDHPHDLLVNTFALGTHLARAASTSPNDPSSLPSPSSNPHSKLILQRSHGFTTTGSSIPEAVYNAIYAVENAIVLNQALNRGSAGTGASQIKSLTDDEVEACSVMNLGSVAKVWPLWVKEVERDPLFAT